jgi:S1-C subfamily serine protease
MSFCLRILPYLLSLLAINTNLGLEAIAAFASSPSVEQVAQTIVVRIEGTSKGSGVIVDRQGTTYTVVTNAHVVKKSGTYIIVTPDRKCYAIESPAVKQVPNRDLAILRFSSPIDYSIAKARNADRLQIGQNVYVSGWARPVEPLYSRVFIQTEGKLTELNSQLPQGYSLTYTNLVRVGMSGGPVLNREGQLLGINGLVRFADNSDNIVASGIAINNFDRWYSAVKSKLSILPGEAVACSRKYLN